MNIKPESLIDNLKRMRHTSLEDYLDFVRSRMAPNSPQTNHMGFAIGLMAECGEFMEEVIAAKLAAVAAAKYGDLVKKEELHARPNSPEHQAKKKKELGDVFWYLFACCAVEGFDPGDVMAENVRKLTERANDPNYAAKNPNVPTNVKPAPAPEFGLMGIAPAEGAARLGDAECHACKVEPVPLGAGFVECRICGTVRKVGESHGECKAPLQGSGCG